MQKLGIAAAILIATMLVWAHPAGAASPVHADALATASYGARRAVAWVQAGDDTGRVWLQYLNSDGTPNGHPILIAKGVFDTDAGESIEIKPDVSVALGPNGALVSYFEDFEEHGTNGFIGPEHYYVPDSGSPVQVDPICDTPYNVSPEMPGSIVWDGSRFIAAAGCQDSGDGSYYLQVMAYDPPLNETTYADPIATDASSTSVAASSSFGVVVWQYVGATGDLDVAAQRLDANLGLVGTPIVVAGGAGDQLQPTIAVSGSGWLAAWIEGTGHDIKGRMIATNGSLGPKKTLVNAAGNQNHPWLAASGIGWHLAWADLRAGNNDVYAAHVSNTLAVSPTNGAIVAGGSGPQQAPTIAALPNGKGFVGYLDQGTGTVRDLTAASGPTGTAQVVTTSPK